MSGVCFLAGVTLQCLVIAALLDGLCRRYPFLFTYVVFSFLSTVSQIAFRYNFGPRSREFVRAYWISDFLGTFLLLMTILHLIRVALEGDRRRNRIYGGLVSCVLIAAAAGALLIDTYSRGFTWSRWMTQVGRDYYFAALLLNFVQWSTLLRVNHPDKQLYLITSGLGLMLSGAAIVHALRLTGHWITFAGYLLVLTYLASLYILRFALKKLPAASRPRPEPMPPAADSAAAAPVQRSG
jgi:hypothetical protein